METESARKFHRVLRLVTLIQGRRGWDVKRLAVELGVEERTVFRYLNDLETMGIPYSFEPESNGYRIRGDFFLPPIQLTPEEALALSVLCEEIGRKEQIAFTDAAWRALSKIEAQLPASVRDELSRMQGHVAVQTARAEPPDGHADVYARVREAISRREALECEYEAADGGGAGETFEFEPYALFFGQRAWYAIGVHGGRGEVRNLRLSRFVRLAGTGRRYEIPETFSVEAHLGNAWRMMRSGPDVSVTVKFDAAFAPTVGETRWHRTQETEEHADGSLTFRCTVSGLDEIVWWALSMGPHCEVLEPPELREWVRDLAARTAALYAPR